MNTNVTPENFIKIWQTSNTVDEVVERTGLTKTKVYQRSGSYRKKGVNLKQMSKSQKKVNWAEMAKLADELAKESKPRK